jgi:hypothetical protein
MYEGDYLFFLDGITANRVEKLTINILWMLCFDDRIFIFSGIFRILDTVYYGIISCPYIALYELEMKIIRLNLETHISLLQFFQNNL